ncbi:alpha/beta fold hydrolase [Spiroplasma sp. TIUS-1]|uniref:alpha/beta hydrolase n=1 Tax=Spiroplasma sp. TIUS-1 TaxID=216963 RepID=UPI0013974C54|nr:alpha/beta hydrolase [Spiroplasma sp. TIUS-1]QHX35773.1 alpha/beta fold hydrolase [Spiroplasma sp. TIUS-1]
MHNSNYRQISKYHYNWWKIIIIILLFPIVVILSLLFAIKFLPYLFKYPRYGFSKSLGVEINSVDHYKLDIKEKGLMNLDAPSELFKEIVIKGSKGDISAVYLINPNSNKWIIGLHGFKRNKYMGIRNVMHFYQQGYNIISFDGYAHGKTYGTKSDFGITNALVLDNVISHIKEIHNPSELGILGVSLGASSALYWAQNYYTENQVDWLIADCAFSQAVPQIRFFLQKYIKIPWYLMSLGINFNFKIVSKSWIKKFNLLKSWSTTKGLPILFIHGEKDAFITLSNAYVMYDMKAIVDAKTEIAIFSNADHSESIVKDFDKYNSLTTQFKQKYIK